MFIHTNLDLSFIHGAVALAKGVVYKVVELSLEFWTSGTGSSNLFWFLRR